ncbi:MAG: FKBP-type peptidyl-prolyl cis-trans isomerase [Myxococcota bacterium]|nr:FKBP-type peptidyl-prolyl cis-trans isomerase [Myxococcota bacterium]
METIQQDTVATLNYTLHILNGTKIDEVKNLAYLHGHANLLPGMEKALEGKKVGDVINAELSPSDAFGEIIDIDPVRVSRNDFGPSFDRLAVGLGLASTNSKGEKILLYVREKQNDYATLSRNHPLAGLSLIFDAAVLDIRCAVDEEKQQGRPLAPKKDAPSCGCC